MLANYSNFLFDLDGTLIDSFEDIKLSLESSYKVVLNKNVLLLRSQVGPPLSEMIEALTPGLEGEFKEAIIKEFRKKYDNSSHELTKEIEGSIQLLTILSNLNKQLFLVTNKLYKPTLQLLKKLNIHLFKDIVTPDKFEGKQLTKTELIKHLIISYNLNITKTVMVGDTGHDVIAAKANSLDSIAILSGYDNMENLKKENPTYIVDTIIQLQNEIH